MKKGFIYKVDAITAVTVAAVMEYTLLTYLPPDKIAAISQTKFSNALLWLKKD